MTKVGDAAEATEDVPNVVGGRNALPEDSVPPVDDALDDLDAGVVYVADGNI